MQLYLEAAEARLKEAARAHGAIKTALDCARVNPPVED